MYQIHTVDGRNPAPVDIVNICKYPIIYRVLAPSQVVGLGIFEPSTVGLQIHSVSPIFCCWKTYGPQGEEEGGQKWRAGPGLKANGWISPK